MTAAGRVNSFWVMATFVVAMLPQFARMPIPVAVMTLLPLLWRIGAEVRGWRPLPALVRHGATVLALVVLFASYGAVSGRRAAVSLLTMMLAFKLIEGFQIRDGRLVVSFSLFLCATQFLFSQDLAMPLYGAAVILVALVALTRLHRSEAWAHAGGKAPPIRASFLSELGFALRLLGIALPAGLAFFMLFPRLASPLWGIPESTLDSKTGLSDSMSPGTSIGAARCSGVSTGERGKAAFTARMSAPGTARQPPRRPGPTPFNSSRMSGTGCSHSITRRRPRRTPG